MEYNFGLALLYAHNLRNLLVAPGMLDLVTTRNFNLKAFNTVAALSITSMLKDNSLSVRHSKSLLALALKPLHFNSEAVLAILQWELEFYSTITNCTVDGSQIKFIAAQGLETQTIEDVDLKLDSILSHGLRWGWTAFEDRGRAMIVNTGVKKYKVDGSGCTCQRPKCPHQSFARSLVSNRTYLQTIPNLFTTSMDVDLV